MAKRDKKPKKAKAEDNIFADAEIISAYSRAQAIEDGVLVDVSEMAKEAGFKFPVAMTSESYHAYVALTPMAQKMGNDIKGRLWDVLWMLMCEIRRLPKGQSVQRLPFKFLCITDKQEPGEVTLHAVIGPGDTPAPVLTIMLPHES